MAARARPEEELAAVANCLCCDTYFVFVLDSVAPRSALRDCDDEHVALLATVQRRAAQQGQDTGWQWPCPFCVERVHGVGPEQAAHDPDLMAVLTPCRLVCFERGCELPPLYMRAAGENTKEAGTTVWELVWGVGPPKLPAASAGGMLPRAALKRFGVRSPPLPASACEDAAARLSALNDAALLATPRRAAAMHAAWTRLRPLFERWPEAQAELTRLIQSEDTNDS